MRGPADQREKVLPAKMGARLRETIALILQFRLAQHAVSFGEANQLAPIRLKAYERRREHVLVGTTGVM